MIQPVKFRREQLAVEIHPDRARMGAAAAEAAAARIRELIEREGQAKVIFACAASQVECLTALRSNSSIDWSRVTAFHMDEYVGMTKEHPASFRRFLQEHLVKYVPLAAFHEIGGDAPDIEAECRRYAELLEANQPGLVIMGIGENGHIAFNDPPVCDFQDPVLIKKVELDEVCRQQQVNDGAFPTLDDVPRYALTLTVPALTRVPRAIVVVPGPTKSAAVRAALNGPIETACPASILRRHPNATLYLDRDSAALLDEAAAHA